MHPSIDRLQGNDEANTVRLSSGNNIIWKICKQGALLLVNKLLTEVCETGSACVNCRHSIGPGLVVNPVGTGYLVEAPR